ncbi:MAG: hypothetical protein H7Z70_04060 [Bacteroidia bacterium]|nr:hypothetical protein [Methylotenera sp.]
MSNTERMSVAALIGVILRRKINRTIDVKWLIENEAYAQEIIKLCREQDLADLTEYADHLEKLMFPKEAFKPSGFAPTTFQTKPPTIQPIAKPIAVELPDEIEAEEEIANPNKYVGGLR